jgi:hypothetical protein
MAPVHPRDGLNAEHHVCCRGPPRAHDRSRRRDGARGVVQPFTPHSSACQATEAISCRGITLFGARKLLIIETLREQVHTPRRWTGG